MGLLGPSRAQRLQERVDQLAVSRTDLIEAVDAERRRIERDLHDGTQQRLVSLAVNLGLAMATRPDLPSDAREVIARAHLEAKEAIAELNDLVRGCTRPCSKTEVWTRRCPGWLPARPCRCGCGSIWRSGWRPTWSQSRTS